MAGTAPREVFSRKPENRAWSSAVSFTKIAMAATRTRAPVAGAPTSIPSLFTSPQALVSRIVGWFHSHPLVPGYDSDMFSGNDLLITRKEGPGYLATPDDGILKLAIDPKGLPQVSNVGSGACQVP